MPPLAIAIEVGEMVIFALSVGAFAVSFTVPAYPPVEVTEIADVPLFPGEEDEMVMFASRYRQSRIGDRDRGRPGGRGVSARRLCTAR